MINNKFILTKHLIYKIHLNWIIKQGCKLLSSILYLQHTQVQFIQERLHITKKIRLLGSAIATKSNTDFKPTALS
jgi:hypothetical protein